MLKIFDKKDKEIEQLRAALIEKEKDIVTANSLIKELHKSIDEKNAVIYKLKSRLAVIEIICK